MQTRTLAALSVILAIAVFPGAPRLAAQPLEASPSHGTTNEFYAPSVTPAIYLVNFLFLYCANTNLAAYMPAYKAPIPQALVDCLEQHPAGCPYAEFRQYFDEPASVGVGNGHCFWPDVCQEKPKWQRLAPRQFRRPNQLNEPLGRRRAARLARLLGIRKSMILTDAEYQCLIGTEPRTEDQETIFRCIYNLTNSKGNAINPLSSYGLNVDEQGNIRSVCGTNAPCIKFNALFAGPLEEAAKQCGCLGKLLRLTAKTPLLHFIDDGNQCQISGGSACLIEPTCTGK